MRVFINVDVRYQESTLVENTVNYAIRQLNLLIFFFMSFLMKEEDCIFISISE